jgi:hypothetical protein
MIQILLDCPQKSGLLQPHAGCSANSRQTLVELFACVRGGIKHMDSALEVSLSY